MKTLNYLKKAEPSTVHAFIKTATDNNNSRIPDSIGDQLFRMNLKMYWELTHGGITDQTSIKAKQLLTRIKNHD